MMLHIGERKPASHLHNSVPPPNVTSGLPSLGLRDPESCVMWKGGLLAQCMPLPPAQCSPCCRRGGHDTQTLDLMSRTFGDPSWPSSEGWRWHGRMN